MLNFDIKEKFYSHYRIANKIPILFAAQCYHTMEDILEEIKEENPYVTISELLSDVSE